MEILSIKNVGIRKKRQCFSCFNVFEAKTKMNRQVNKYEGQLNSIYSCLTCIELIKKHRSYFFDEMDRVYHEGCVKEMMNEMGTKTPEILLSLLNTNPNL